MMLKVGIPVEAGNRGIKDESLPKTLMGFVERAKPEAAYFVAENGQRTAFFVFDMKDPTEIPPLVEPFMMNLNASVSLQPAMNIEDMQAGVQKAMKG